MKRMVILLFTFVIIIFNGISDAKYVMEYKSTIAQINIDTIPPKIEVISIESKEKEKNASNIYSINVKVKIIENNIKENDFNKSQIIIRIGEMEFNKELYEVNQIAQTNNSIIYEIKINEINKKGILQILIPQGIVKDFSNNENQEKIINYQLV
ncbi:MAG: hypothetical protein ACI4VH_01015 [Clostridia bacterium]